jgi:hydrogenase maturation protease
MTPAEKVKSLIVGVGNESMGDDAIGLHITSELGKRLRTDRGEFPKIDIVAHCGDCLSLIEAWDGYEQVIMIDAARPSGTPGKITQFDVVKRQLPVECFSVSSHTLGIAEAIELARLLGKLPKRCFVIGVEAERIEASTELSPVLAGQIVDITSEITTVIGTIFHQ